MSSARKLPSGVEKARAVRSMFDRIAPRYDVMNRLMTFGMDVGWRRRTVRALSLPRGARVLDIACGTGDLCRELAAASYVPFGFDLSFGMLAAARTDAPLVQADALRLPVADGAADGISCGFALRNVVSLEGLFEEFARALRSGGRAAVLEVAEPDAAFLRWGHNLYFRRFVPVLGGVISDRDAYRYLPESTAYLPSTERLLEMLQAAGFDSVERVLLSMGAAQLITGRRS